MRGPGKRNLGVKSEWASREGYFPAKSSRRTEKVSEEEGRSGRWNRLEVLWNVSYTAVLLVECKMRKHYPSLMILPIKSLPRHEIRTKTKPCRNVSEDVESLRDVFFLVLHIASLAWLEFCI